MSARWRFEAIGTGWVIDTQFELAPAVRAAVDSELDRFDRVWSRFREDSLVTRMSREAGSHELPAEADPLFDLYRQLYVATGGRVSPLVGRALEQLGYDSTYRLRPAVERDPVPSWDDVIAWDGSRLNLIRPALIDVGAAGKGLLVDLISDVLLRHDVPEHVVDASGDIRRRGLGVERIALEHPADPTKAIGVVELGDGALCASASNRRAWADMHHIIDAVTGQPTRGVIATWALVGCGGAPPQPTMIADGLATALFFATPGTEDAEDLATLGPAEWVRMWADGRIETSPSWPGEVFR